ncbi:MAG: hypothetical protein JJU36_06210 [Phycisphaeraceae bacterium]|nr:hypothetical protein [Phycisphaeraceae bacterium]
MRLIRRFFKILAAPMAAAMLLTTPAIGDQPDLGLRPIARDRDDQAQVLHASFLGGSGHEWLAAGGFQADGTIVVAGNVIGQELNLGTRTSVLGRDLPAPAAITEWPTDRRGREERPSWTQQQATGFVARISADGRRLISVHRMPWQSGSITSALVGEDGSIYIAGRAQNGIVNLGGQHQALAVEGARGGDGVGTFFAKLNSDASRVLWLKTIAGQSNAPRLEERPNGNIAFFAQDYRVFDANGRQVEHVPPAGSVRQTTAVSPVDGKVVRSGERHWRTGREPWRCPLMDTYLPDGTHEFQLYRWPGPYVGLDNSRQVSDSAIRLARYNRDGTLTYVAWSDGGNSVMVSPPMDVRQSVGLNGLGMSPAGAGVLSIAYLITLDPQQDMQVVAWTRLLATMGPNRPNSVWIRSLEESVDGSILIAGDAARNLIQTSNHINDGVASGTFIGVLNRELNGLRFLSVVPGAGAARIGDDGNSKWGIATRSINGRTRALFVGSAVDEGESYGVTTATPTRNALRDSFAGGRSDGYFVVLDLGPTPSSIDRVPAPERDPPRLSVRNHGQQVGRDRATPNEGARMPFLPNNPRYISVDAEIRETSGEYWPNYFYGRPVSGELVYREAGSTMTVTVDANQRVQDGGKQHRRVLGELMEGGQEIGVKLTIHRLGERRTDQFQFVDGRGREQNREVTYYPARGTLEIGGRAVEVDVDCQVQWLTRGRDGVSVGARVNAYISLKGSDLGLRELADRTIEMRITFQANPAADGAR